MPNRMALIALTFAVSTATTGVWAQTDAPSMEEMIDYGAYLAGRQAIEDADFTEATRYLDEALATDPSNMEISRDAMFAALGTGDFAAASKHATTLEDGGEHSRLTRLARNVVRVQSQDWDAVLTDLIESDVPEQIEDGLLKAWAIYGQGQVTQALEVLQTMQNQEGAPSLAPYHQALMLAQVGDFEGAANLFAAADENNMLVTARANFAYIQVLTQLGRFDEARALVDQMGPTTTGELQQDLLETLNAEEPMPFTIVRSAEDGVAEVYYNIAAVADALNGNGRANRFDYAFVLFYGQAATALRPDFSQATLIIAEQLTELEQYERAAEQYARVSADDPNYATAQLGMAESLWSAGESARAIEEMKALSEKYPQSLTIISTTADYLRVDEQFAASEPYYTEAITLAGENAGSLAYLHFARGITYERMGEWDKAEADFRKSLEINPNQPNVLNYLGYSLVDRNEKLDEALEMIKQAVAAEPNSGAIVDSLGWALYRLGRYDEAVIEMERAVELLSTDPVVTDHLGDVYWAVGRKTEARFQWQRALSFEPEEKEAGRIRRKLDIGLDAVLEEEGAAPLQTQNDNG